MTEAMQDLIRAIAREAYEAMLRGEFEEPRTIPESADRAPQVPRGADAA